MEVKHGYKQTEVGVIPEEWDVQPFAALAHVERGKFTARPRNDPKYYGGDIPFIQTGDVTKANGQITTYSQTLNAAGLKVSKLFPRGTLFFTIAANIGDVGFAAFDTACPDSLVAITAKKNTDKTWLSYELAKRKGAFQSIATHNAQLNINLEKLRPYLLPVPRPPEQRAIAEALSDVDSLLGGLERLVAKKRDHKLSVMQQLLTGQTRLPGFGSQTWSRNRSVLGEFPIDWELIPLSRVSDFITKGSTPTTYGYQWVNSGILFLRSECVSEQGLDLSESMFITPEAHLFLRRSEVKAGDILMTITGNVGRVVHLDNKFPPSNINQHIARIRITDDRAVTSFIFHFLSQPLVRKYYNQITTGQAYPQISLVQVRDTTLPMPPASEQTAIAEVLSDMDAELWALEQRREKTRALKQAMMRELLTGKIRLV